MIDEDFAPTTVLSITYPHHHSPKLGNTLSPSDTQDKPSVQFTPEPDQDATYTIVLTDPDAPSRDNPTNSEFCHWIETGVKAPSVQSISVADRMEETVVKGWREIVEYMGPAPPKGTLASPREVAGSAFYEGGLELTWSRDGET